MAEKVIPIIIAAHNEERSIRRCLVSILQACHYAESRLPLSFVVIVGADRCTDQTVEIAQELGARVIETSGGKVETQRSCLQGAEFTVFMDADIAILPETLYGLCDTMIGDPQVQVAYPPKEPLYPRRRSWIAKAGYYYSKDEGFRKKRYWFDGKCFAIRSWNIPKVDALKSRCAELPEDNFYRYEKGVLIDDVYLSRWVLHTYGADAMRKSVQGCMYFRNPESLRSMYAYYRRILRELERIDVLFPELLESMKVLDAPQVSWERFRAATLSSKVSYFIFKAVDRSFGPIYRLERWYYQNIADRPPREWPVILETKHYSSDQ